MQKREEFTETVSAISRESGASPLTVKNYTALGFIECFEISNGMKLYQKGAAKIVREKLKERLNQRRRPKGSGRIVSAI